MAYASLEQVSEFLKLSPRRVNQLAKEEGMPRVSRGEYELAKCAQWYIEYLRKQLYEAQHGTETESQARTRLIQVTIRLRELDLIERSEEIIRIDDVWTVLGAAFDAMRTKVLSIPVRVEPFMKAKKAKVEITAQVEHIMADVLREMSNVRVQLEDIPRKKRRMRLRAGRFGGSSDQMAETEADLAGRVASVEREMGWKKKSRRFVKKRKSLAEEREEIRKRLEKGGSQD